MFHLKLIVSILKLLNNVQSIAKYWKGCKIISWKYILFKMTTGIIARRYSSRMLLNRFRKTLKVDLPECSVCLNKLLLWVAVLVIMSVFEWMLQLAISKAGQNFPLTFFSSKCDGQRNTQTTMSFLTFKLALRIALIHFSFSV